MAVKGHDVNSQFVVSEYHELDEMGSGGRAVIEVMQYEIPYVHKIFFLSLNPGFKSLLCFTGSGFGVSVKVWSMVGELD